jgi:hypothetical protein
VLCGIVKSPTSALPKTAGPDEPILRYKRGDEWSTAERETYKPESAMSADLHGAVSTPGFDAMFVRVYSAMTASNYLLSALSLTLRETSLDRKFNSSASSNLSGL